MALRTAPPPRRDAAAVDGQPQRGLPSLRGALRRQDPGREDRLPPGHQQLPEYFATRPLVPLEGAAVNLLDLLRAPAVGSPLAERAARPDSQALEAAAGRQPGALSADGRRDSARRRTGHLDAVQSSPAAARAASRQPPRKPRAPPRDRPAAVASMVSHSDVPVFGDPAHEYEKFSADTAWMPTPC
jgi:hypothetical protein